MKSLASLIVAATANITIASTPALYAKANRQRRMNIGAKRSQFPLPGGRDDRIKKKITGEVVPR